jgi:hypothetical protein
MEEIIITAFTDFVTKLNEIKWFGREREVVSKFVLSSLVSRCIEGSPLYDIGQISIEGAVPQMKSPDKKTKNQVNKDLVIWDKPHSTCWNEKFEAVNHPVSIIEWKVEGYWTGKKLNSKNTIYDIEWLKQYSHDKPDFIGFSFFLNFYEAGKAKGRIVSVKNGSIKNEIEV